LKLPGRTLRDFAKNKTGCDLLRIYWYDGVTAKGLTADHQKIASCNDIKIRLGFINSAGQQKGVDSLIVTDLVELARNRATCDAVLVAGDEDTRIGVQIAQSYGVRIHLLGIHPARSNQSKQLIQEADTISEWTRDVVMSFLSVVPGLGSVDESRATGFPCANYTPVSGAPGCRRGIGHPDGDTMRSGVRRSIGKCRHLRNRGALDRLPTSPQAVRLSAAPVHPRPAWTKPRGNRAYRDAGRLHRGCP
jgi:hypothetical protein